MQAIHVETLSARPTKALSRGNSSQDYFWPLPVMLGPPDQSAVLYDGTQGAMYDGVWNAGSGGQTSSPQVKVYPYALGEPGVDWWMRVYGWVHMDQTDLGSTWVPYLLVELYCVAGTQGGALDAGGHSVGQIGAKEFFASTILVTNGTLGKGTLTLPGAGMIAFVELDLTGCQKFQFDFITGEELPCFPNAIWCRA